MTGALYVCVYGERMCVRNILGGGENVCCEGVHAVVWGDEPARASEILLPQQ